MNIAIDCRYIGKSGIGRVCEGILDNLDFQANSYYLIGKYDKLKKYPCKEIVKDDTEPYSFKGLLSYERSLNKKCDAIIIPNFLIPFGIKIPIYSVMHDLIFMDLPDVTTSGFFDKTIKKFLLKKGMKKSQKIACVSAFTKSRCEYYFKRYSEKCFVNYIGLSRDVLEYDVSGTIKENKIIYVGNVKPHKGLKTLIEAYKKLPSGKYILKIIGEKDNFLVGMEAAELECEGVEFTGKLSNEQLLKEIATAKFLVQPSLYEGFGLPPLEALYLETKPIISDIPVFREIYSAFDVTFFHKEDRDDLCDKILSVDSAVKNSRTEIIQSYNYKKFEENILYAIYGKI